MKTPSLKTEILSRRYEMLFTQTRDIILFVRREDGRILDANDAAVKAYGYSRDELLSMSIKDLRTSLDRMHIDSQMGAAEKHSILFETVHRRKDGSTMPVEVSSAGATLEGERTLISVIRDLTERKEAEAALEHRVALEQLVARISIRFANVRSEELDDCIDVALAEIGTFTHVDRSYLFQYSSDRSTASNTHEWCSAGIAPQKQNLQDFPSDTLKWWNKKIKADESIIVQSVSELPPEALAEKELFQSQEIISLLAVPVKCGSRLGFLGFDSVRVPKHWVDEDIHLLRMAADIISTALLRVQQEQSMRRSEDRLQMALRAAELGVWEVDLVSDAVTASPRVAEIFGVRQSHSLRTREDWRAFILEQERPLFKNTLEEAVASESGKSRVELRFRRASDNAVRWVSSDTYVHKDDFGRPVRLVGVISDITERKRVERERELSIEFLNLIAVEGRSTREMLRLTVAFFKRASTCDAVGVRFKQGEDYPYSEAEGFSPEFIKEENCLCAHDQAGRPNGPPLLEGMCGKVISGDFDPVHPFFTSNGSFWTNSTTELMAGDQHIKNFSHMRFYCTTTGYESLALIPLRIGPERLGLIQMAARTKGLFTPEDIQLWERLAEILSVAVAKSQAEQSLRERELELKTLNEQLEHKVSARTADLERRNKEIRELAHKTINTMENDRKALSKELHDSVCGTLAAIKYQLEGRVEEMESPPESGCMPLEKVIDYLGIAITESRRITKQLRPLVLDELGLAAAIDQCIRDFEQFQPEIKVKRRISISEEGLSSDVKTVLYRVLQEGLNNIGKHSRADNVQLQLNRTKYGIDFCLQDDGVGFDPRELLYNRQALGGYGLHSMKERVEICKGNFKIESVIGEGTTIKASIPT
jgi:PAS domain S-box-containing protein